MPVLVLEMLQCPVTLRRTHTWTVAAIAAAQYQTPRCWMEGISDMSGGH